MPRPLIKANWHNNIKQDIIQDSIQNTDPRLAIARHIEWAKSYSNDTIFSLPEPDNYNYAVIAKQALDTGFIQNQVFYRERYGRFWVSVYLVPTEQDPAWTAWLQRQDYIRYWYCNNAQPLRIPRPLLWSRQDAIELSLTEKLYIDGYYERFIAKYHCDGLAEFVNNRLGKARANLKQLISDQDEQELEYDT